MILFLSGFNKKRRAKSLPVVVNSFNFGPLVFWLVLWLTDNLLSSIVLDEVVRLTYRQLCCIFRTLLDDECMNYQVYLYMTISLFILLLSILFWRFHDWFLLKRRRVIPCVWVGRSVSLWGCLSSVSHAVLRYGWLLSLERSLLFLWAVSMVLELPVGGVVHPHVVGTYFMVDRPTDHGFRNVNATVIMLFIKGVVVWSTFVVPSWNVIYSPKQMKKFVWEKKKDE